MQKKDIKPGVVYAYKRLHREPQPIVFLNAPADGELYRERRLPGSAPAGTPVFARDPAAPRPHPGRSYSSGPVGYPAARFRWNAPEDGPARLLALTLADFQAATSAYREDGIEFTVITLLTPITGPYAQEKAAYDVQRRAAYERDERRRTPELESRQRAGEAAAKLAGHGITVGEIPPYGLVPALSLPVAEAEKLIGLLGPSSLLRELAQNYIDGLLSADSAMDAIAATVLAEVKGGVVAVPLS